jgi:hypothetical protein
VFNYFTHPGSFGLGPVVVSSEPYSMSDVHQSFSLEDLLKRKLGADNPQRTPWEFSSINKNDRTEVNEAIRRAPPGERFDLALHYLEPRGEYDSFLTIASRIWHENAARTRVPGPGGKMAQEMGQIFRKCLEMHRESRADEAAKQLLECIRGDRLILPDKEVEISRSTVRPYMHQLFGGRSTLDIDLNRAWCEAFVRFFPSGVGWISDSNTDSRGAWEGPEPLSDPKPKARVSDALSEVSIMEVETGGPPIFDRITYTDLLNLRKDQNSCQSLLNVQEKWAWKNIYLLKHAISEHISIIYSLLGAKKFSKMEVGPNVIIIAAEMAATMSTGLYLSRGSVSWQSMAPLLTVLLKNLFLCEYEKTTPDRQKAQLCDRIVSASVADAAKLQG